MAAAKFRSAAIARRSASPRSCQASAATPPTSTSRKVTTAAAIRVRRTSRRAAAARSWAASVCSRSSRFRSGLRGSLPLRLGILRSSHEFKGKERQLVGAARDQIDPFGKRFAGRKQIIWTPSFGAPPQRRRFDAIPRAEGIAIGGDELLSARPNRDQRVVSRPDAHDAVVVIRHDQTRCNEGIDQAACARHRFGFRARSRPAGHDPLIRDRHEARQHPRQSRYCFKIKSVQGVFGAALDDAGQTAECVIGSDGQDVGRGIPSREQFVERQLEQRQGSWSVGCRDEFLIKLDAI